MKCELSFFILQLYHRCLLKLSVGTHLVVKKCNHNLLTALLLQFQSVFSINCSNHMFMGSSLRESAALQIVCVKR